MYLFKLYQYHFHGITRVFYAIDIHVASCFYDMHMWALICICGHYSFLVACIMYIGFLIYIEQYILHVFQYCMMSENTLVFILYFIQLFLCRRVLISKTVKTKSIFTKGRCDVDYSKLSICHCLVAQFLCLLS